MAFILSTIIEWKREEILKNMRELRIINLQYRDQWTEGYKIYRINSKHIYN